MKLGMTSPVDQKKNDENRRKILRVSECDVLGLLRDMDNLPGFVRLPRFEIPEGVKVCGVYPKYESRSFEFVLEHESFDPVPEGMLLPHIAVGHVSVPLAVQEGLTA